MDQLFYEQLKNTIGKIQWDLNDSLREILLELRDLRKSIEEIKSIVEEIQELSEEIHEEVS